MAKAKGGGRWVTMNGTPVHIGSDGDLKGRIGDKVEKASSPKLYSHEGSRPAARYQRALSQGKSEEKAREAAARSRNRDRSYTRRKRSHQTIKELEALQREGKTLTQGQKKALTSSRRIMEEEMPQSRARGQLDADMRKLKGNESAHHGGLAHGRSHRPSGSNPVRGLVHSSDSPDLMANISGVPLTRRKKR